jgi:predicted acyltransferase
VAAARLLVGYWETRRKLFGPDRALLPLTQIGAMAKDMEHLHKALVSKLSEH